MSLLTEAMRQTDQRKICAFQRKICAFQRKNGKWSAVEMANHPTPSGAERWLPTYSDNREWPDEKTAIDEFTKVLHPPMDLKKMLDNK